MEKTQIIIIAAVVAILAIRLYQKFIKKDKINPGTQTNSSSGSPSTPSAKDDDYEPYSKK